MGPRVRFGLNVGAKEGEVTEEVGFEVLVSSLNDSAVVALIDLVTPTEGETVNRKEKKKRDREKKYYTKNLIAQKL